MNLGNYFAHPYESDFNKFRRLVFSNSRLYRSKSKNIGLSVSTHLKNLGSTILEPHRTEILRIAKNRSSRVMTNRHCPQCYQLGFHADVFNALWMVKCPVHQEPLSERCANCRNRFGVTLSNPHCEQCI